MRNKTLLAVLLAAIAGGVSAQMYNPSGATVVETSPGRGVASTTSLVSARVTRVDAAARVVELELGDGRAFTVVAGSEVRNLEQLGVGDVVNVAYIESLVLQLKKDGRSVVTRTQTQDLDRAPRGAKPGGVAQKQETVVADVLAVDRATGNVTLRGPERTVNLRIKDPAQLALIQPGDQVEATYTEAVAVAVDPAR
jgi:hypothetical protein